MGQKRRPAQGIATYHMEESRNYEFAYHITTQLDEAKVPAIQQEVEALMPSTEVSSPSRSSRS